MRNKGRKAGITIEIALSIALSVIVLFLVIGLFSENLKTMMSRIGLKSFFRASEKTTVADWGDDPTATQINVQIAADYGLSSEHKKAKAAIEDYYNNKSTNGRLNDLKADQRNLAKELTKYALSGKSTDYLRTLEEPISSSDMSYLKFGSLNGIRLGENSYGHYTEINENNGERIRWDNDYFNSENSNDRLKSISKIESKF